MKRMAIISSTNFVDWPMGGMLSFLRDIIPYLSRYFEIELWGVNTNKKESEKITIGNNDFKIYYFSHINTSKKKILPKLIKVVLDIYKHKNFILGRGYDILYFHGIPLELAFLKNRTPSIVTHVHGITNPFSVQKGLKSNKIFQILYEKVRKKVIDESHLVFLAADTPAYKRFLSMFKGKNNIVKIHNFANPKIFYKKSKETIRKKLAIDKFTKIIIFTGRLSYHKDPCLALTTFKIFSENLDEKALFFIVGDGPLLAKCKSIAAELGLRGKVYFWGKQPRENLAELLSTSDVYLYSSFNNGVPISLIEALMCGLPVVTPDISGIHDAVIDGETGFIASSRDPYELATLLKKALNNAEQMGEKCIKKASEFTPENAAQKITKEINRLWA